MGNLRFLSEFHLNFPKVEIIAFSSGYSRLISSLQVFFLSMCPSLEVTVSLICFCVAACKNNLLLVAEDGR